MKKLNVKKSHWKPGRRSSFKLVGAGTITAGVSEQWMKPVVQTIILPAHAATSTFTASCEISFSRDMHVTGNAQKTEIPRTGTFPNDTQIAGVYSGVMPGAATSQGNCKGTQIGFQALPLTVTIEELS